MAFDRSQILPVHAVLFAFYSYSLVYDIIYIDIGWQGYGGRFKYLTFLNLIVQTVYFGLATWSDVKQLGRNGKDTKKTGLQKFLDTFLASVVYPVGTFVVMTFWGIYMVDRELVYPKRLDKIIPQWLNHVMHTTVFPILIVEKYLVYHEYPYRRKGLSIMLAFAMAYLVWILWIAYYADIWVYPILQVMEAHQRALFIGILLAFFCSVYILGESLNTFFWRKTIGAARTSKTPKAKSKKIN